MLAGDRGDVGEVGMHGNEAASDPRFGLQHLGAGNSGGIGIEGEHRPIRGGGGKERPRVAATTKSAVEIAATGARLQGGNRFRKKDRLVSWFG